MIASSTFVLRSLIPRDSLSFCFSHKAGGGPQPIGRIGTAPGGSFNFPTFFFVSPPSSLPAALVSSSCACSRNALFLSSLSFCFCLKEGCAPIIGIIDPAGIFSLPGLGMSFELVSLVMLSFAAFSSEAIRSAMELFLFALASKGGSAPLFSVFFCKAAILSEMLDMLKVRRLKKRTPAIYVRPDC